MRSLNLPILAVTIASIFSPAYCQQDLITALESHPNTTEYAKRLTANPIDLTGNGPFLILAPDNQAVLGSTSALSARLFRYIRRAGAAQPSDLLGTFPPPDPEAEERKSKNAPIASPTPSSIKPQDAPSDSVSSAASSDASTAPSSSITPTSSSSSITPTDSSATITSSPVPTSSLVSTATNPTSWSYEEFLKDILGINTASSAVAMKRLMPRQTLAVVAPGPSQLLSAASNAAAPPDAVEPSAVPTASPDSAATIQGPASPADSVMPVPDSGIFTNRDRQITVNSLLKDPAFVNLGGDGQAVVVNRYVDPATQKMSIRVTSGLGNTQQLTDERFSFDRGGVRVAENFLTVPKTFSASLEALNATRFLSLVRQNGLFNDLENTPYMTVFVPIDTAFSAGSSPSVCACEKMTIDSWVGYTPQLVDGQSYVSRAGSELKIAIKDGDYYVNGVRVVRPNVITKNGVVHLIEKQITSNTVAPNAPPNGCAARELSNGASAMGFSAMALGLAGLTGLMVL
ncbi:hypothetical protein BZA77DRAFT_317222 [Pyronema omphalodes]|nr:hypothetical protein BZA77DRAFT_317222 [Pyronema omphalodes]